MSSDSSGSLRVVGEIAQWTTENLLTQKDGSVILDCWVAPETSQPNPDRASRYIHIRGEDGRCLAALREALPKRSPLTTLTTTNVAQLLRPWNATAHSIKRGAGRHAAEIVAENEWDLHLVPRLLKHADPFGVTSATMRYLGISGERLTGISTLVAQM